MIVGLPPTVGQLESDAPDLNYGTAPIPTEDGSPVTLGVADHLMAFDNGEDKAEAIKAFLDFFYSPEQYTAFVETENFIPVTKSGGEALADNEALAPFIEILPDAQFYPSTNPNWSAAQGAIQELIGQIGQGQDPATVLADIQARADG